MSDAAEDKPQETTTTTEGLQLLFLLILFYFFNFRTQDRRGPSRH